MKNEIARKDVLGDIEATVEGLRDVEKYGCLSSARWNVKRPSAVPYDC